jgi:transcriptional regulator with XRE-family HTH domain
MPRQGNPADLRLVVSFIRTLRKWTQEELSRASGVDRGLISDYELGDKAPTRRTLERLAAAVRLPHSYIDALLPMFRAARLASEGVVETNSRAGARTAPESVADGLDRAILNAVLPRIKPHLMQLEALVIGGEAVPQAEARRQAGELWEALSRLPPMQRRAAVEAEPKYWTWALSERLCTESEKSAAHRAAQAAELAKLALRVAELAPGSEPWRSRLQGYVWAFIANARRVQGDLPGAEEAFLRSDRLWETGAPADPGVLDGSRPLDLKGSLRQYQGRFEEALDLFELAQSAAKGVEAVGRLLIKKASTLRLMGDFQRSLSELRQANSLVQGSQDARLSWLVQYLLAANLGDMGCHTEAEAMLPAVRGLAVELGNELDVIRVLWLEGRVVAGLKRRGEALPALEQVRRYFTTNQIAYDAALASLEVAVLYLEAGRTGEVKRLAEEMLWIFKAQGVRQDALAALKLFYDAAKREEATVGLAREILDYLNKARHNPELRFHG